MAISILNKQNLHITSSSAIQGGSFSKNGRLLFEDRQTPDIVQLLINAYKHFAIDYPRFYKMDSLCKLGLLATEILLQDAGLMQKYKPEEVALCLCNASSSLDTDKKYYHTIAEMASPALFVYTLPNIVIGEICIRHGFKGENLFLIENELDEAFLKRQATLLLQPAGTKACIYGWVELLGNSYNAVVYLMEKNDAAEGITFTPEKND